MKKRILIFLILLPYTSKAQQIENIDYFLEKKNIVITYDLVKCTTNDLFDITVTFINQNNEKYEPVSLSGDLKSISCGNRKIVWNVRNDRDEFIGKWRVLLEYNVAEKSKYARYEIKIGNQVWMNKNLDVIKFRNGDIIPEVKTKDAWENAIKNRKPVWCFYNYSSEKGQTYGKLYNWYAVNDPRGLAPEGWHIPTDNEWSILANYTGGILYAGIEMKNSVGWSENGDETNRSGFTALAGGFLGIEYFNQLGTSAFWWSSTEQSSSNAWCRYLISTGQEMYRMNVSKIFGLSVRCIKDQ